MHHWIKTKQGRVEFRPDGPKFFYPSRAALIADISASLNAQKRCLGRMDWSVAEHSIAVALYLRGEGASIQTAFAALFHDAHEAFIGDLPYPLVASWPEHVLAYIEAAKAQIDTEIRQNIGEVFFEGADWDSIEVTDKLMFQAEFSNFIPCDTWVTVGGRGSLDLMKATVFSERGDGSEILHMISLIQRVRSVGLNWETEVWRLITAMDAETCGWFENGGVKGER